MGLATSVTPAARPQIAVRPVAAAKLATAKPAAINATPKPAGPVATPKPALAVGALAAGLKRPMLAPHLDASKRPKIMLGQSPGLATPKPGLATATAKPGLATAKAGLATAKPGLATAKPALATAKPAIAAAKPGMVRPAIAVPRKW